MTGTMALPLFMFAVLVIGVILAGRVPLGGPVWHDEGETDDF